MCIAYMYVRKGFNEVVWTLDLQGLVKLDRVLRSANESGTRITFGSNTFIFSNTVLCNMGSMKLSLLDVNRICMYI
jgi:hypothetical protein